jgi:hypothetical protein
VQFQGMAALYLKDPTETWDLFGEVMSAEGS